MYDTTTAGGHFITGPYDSHIEDGDHLQRLAKREGYYITNDRVGKNSKKWVIFSRVQAIECLTNRTVLIAGDSYNYQLFIGLADILIGDDKHTDLFTEFPGHHPRYSYLHKMKDMLKKDERLNGVKFVCSELKFCYGAGGNLGHCRRCLSQWKSDALIVGTTIHLLRFKGATIEGVINDIIELTKQIKLTWVSGPSYNATVVPYPYNETTVGTMADTIQLHAASKGEEGFLRQSTKYSKYGVPFLDFNQLTQGCSWSNCTADGGHRSRFVNRMKAQLVLNLLCKLE